MRPTPLPDGWEDEVLDALGAPVTTANVELEDAWFDEEHGGPASNPKGLTGGYDEGGRDNPFDTTLGSPESGVATPKGATVYNGVGVMNYSSFAQGVEYTVATLEEPQYSKLTDALRAGHSTLAQLEALEDATPWGTAFPDPTNDPPAVPATTSTKAKLTGALPYPGGSWDPLNIPAEAKNDVSSSLDSVGHLLLEALFVMTGGALIVVGAFLAAGKTAKDAGRAIAGIIPVPPEAAAAAAGAIA